MERILIVPPFLRSIALKPKGNAWPIIMQLLIVFVIFAIFTKFNIPRTSVYYRYVFFEPKLGVYLTERDVVLESGESFRLGLRTVNKRMTFSSTDFKVAFVDKLGKVTAYQPGLAFIEVKVEGEVLRCRVRVLKLNHSSIQLKVGETKDLNIRGVILGESYESSNPSVASVNFRGKIVAKSAGNTVIKATAKGKTMECKVTVTGTTLKVKEKKAPDNRIEKNIQDKNTNPEIQNKEGNSEIQNKEGNSEIQNMDGNPKIQDIDRNSEMQNIENNSGSPDTELNTMGSKENEKNSSKVNENIELEQNETKKANDASNQ